MPDYAPVNGGDLGETVTYTASGAIAGGNLLKFTAADTVAAADQNCTNYAGVAAHDAASGAPVTVWIGAGLIHETLAVATTAAGALVYVGAAGVAAGQVGTGNTGGYTPAIGVAVRTTMTTTAALRWKSLVG